MCFSYLAYTETKQQDYNYGSSWWTTYFADPKSEDMSFAIENHSSETNFHWQISRNKEIIAKGDVKIEIGKTQSVHVAKIDTQADIITVKVSTPKGSKEIYKKFN